MKRKNIITVLLLFLLFTFSIALNAEASEVSGEYEYTLLDDGTVRIDRYTGSDIEVSLPSKLDGKVVTELGSEAFPCINKTVTTQLGGGRYKTEYIVLPNPLKSVKISKGIKTIATSAFSNCKYLEKITVSGANEHFSASKGVLYNKDKTTLISVPFGKKMDTFKIPSGVKTIKTMAITAITAKEIVVPSTVTKIEEDGIYFCNDLITLRFEKGKLKTIGTQAVSHCERLQVVEIPANVKSVGRFFDCKALKEINVNADNAYYSSKDGVLYNKKRTKLVLYPRGRTDKAYTVPDSVTSLGEFCFYGAKVEVLGIHKGVNKIGKQAYAYASAMKEIRYEGSKTNYKKIRGGSDYGNDGYDSIVVCKSHVHDFKEKTTKSATVERKGKIKFTCDCGYSYTRTIYQVKSISLSTKEYTYNGKKKTPSVIVTDTRGRRLMKGTEYTVSYASGRKMPGKYRVKITLKGRYSGSKTRYFVIEPKAPKDVKASQTTTTITLSWDKVKGADGYRIYRYDTDTKASTKLATVTSTKYKIKRLKSGTKYHYAIRAYTKTESDKIWSVRTEVIATSTKPKAPVITAKAGTKKAVISWDKVKGATGYVIYMATSKSGTYKKVGSVKSGTLTYTCEKLTSRKKYYFKVRAYTTNAKRVYGAYSDVNYVKVK